MKTIEVDCRKCAMCTGNECIIYGKNADEATKKCAEDNFAKYTTHEKFQECAKGSYKANECRKQEGEE